MLERRLEYQSLKAVLLHMDANVRFKISLHMPSIRSVEKVVPLKLNHLYMTDHVTMVNGTYYEVGVDQHYPEGNAPEEGIDDGCFDYDEFGFPFASDIRLPGDVSFQRGIRNVQLYTEEGERTCRRDLRHYEKALEILNQMNSRGVTVEDYRRSLENVPFESDEDRDVRNVLYRDSRDLGSWIEWYKRKLVPFDCRRNNTKRSFDCYIEFYILKGEYNQYQRFEYNKKLFEAAKYLNEVLFGGRTMPIRVGELELPDKEVYRLPVGFRLHAQKARFGRNGITHKNFPLIVENLESLNSLEVTSHGLRFNAHKCQIVRNAKRLLIETGAEFDWQQLSQLIRELSNLEIGIQTQHSTCSVGFCCMLILAWLNGNRQVGASFWVETGEDKTGYEMVEEVLKLIETRYERSEKNERCITIPLSNSAVLEASYGRHRKVSWMVKMNIVKA